MSTLWLIPILVVLVIAAYFIFYRKNGKSGRISGAGSDNPPWGGSDKGSGDAGGSAAE